jgi:CheY-like chemotaxis protein
MVVLSVTDTGIGMDEETQRHIFEPFYTTKAAGAGTGLGLATVYGVVRQSGGHLEVESTPGKGSTFRLFLPRVEAAVDATPAEGAKAGKARAGETILVVEDEPAVRALLQRALGRAGFNVLAAADARAARELSKSQKGRIHLLLTDVVMPGEGGRALADDLTAERPDLKVIYMSGYTDDVIARQRVRDPGVAFLQKPFTADQVSSRIRDVLDGKDGSG